MKNRKLLVFILLLVTFLAFIPSLYNGFTNWDDPDHIINNQFIREFSFANTVKIFTEKCTENYLPLTILSYNVEYLLVQLNPFLYHFDNLLLHLLNCILVFYFIFLLCGKNRIAFITAFLFGLHPLHVESVAWLSERKDVLYAFFYLISLILYLQYRKKKKTVYLAGVTVFFVFSLLSKAMAITLPLALFLLDYYLGEKQGKKLLLEKIPLFVLALFFGVFGFIRQQTHGAIMYERVFSVTNNIFNAFYNLGFYMYKLLLPVNLSHIYDYPLTIAGRFPLIILFVVAAGIVLYLRNKKITFAFLFYICVVFPVLHLVPLGVGIPADRYTYISSLGLFYLCAEGFENLAKRYKEIKLKKLILTGAAVLIGVLLLILTSQRCFVWHDSASLLTDAYKKNPESRRAVHNLSAYYLEAERYDDAINCLTGCIEKNPDFNLAYNLRALAYIKKGEFAKARKDVAQIIANNPKAEENCKKLLELCDRTEKREKKGVSKEEGELTEQGRISLIKGNYKEAVQQYSKALLINPGFPDYMSNRGVAYSALGDLEKALADLNGAIRNQQKSVVSEYYFNRGNVYRKLGRLSEAIADYSIAIKKEPGKSEYYNNRGICYNGKKMYSEALADFESAIRINPANKNAVKNRDLLLKR